MNSRRMAELVAAAAVCGLCVWLCAVGSYSLFAVVLALVVCFLMFTSFEKKESGGREAAVIAVMTALGVAGRIIFAPLPGFKPVTALVVITGAAFGRRAGFMTGSMTALLSNIYFGQGPWTPFQMAAWGIIGLLAGLIFHGRRNVPTLPLVVYGAFSGVLFSLIMDVWTTLSLGEGFSAARYGVLVASSLPTMAVYVVSNVLFLLPAAKPLMAKLGRIHVKYGVF